MTAQVREAFDRLLQAQASMNEALGEAADRSHGAYLLDKAVEELSVDLIRLEEGTL